MTVSFLSSIEASDFVSPSVIKVDPGVFVFLALFSSFVDKSLRGFSTKYTNKIKELNKRGRLSDSLRRPRGNLFS